MKIITVTRVKSTSRENRQKECNQHLIFLHVTDENSILPFGDEFQVLLIDKKASVRLLILHQLMHIYSCPCNKQDFFPGSTHYFFSPSRHYSTLPSFQAKSHNSHCSEKWAKWNRVGGGIIHHDSWVVSLRKWGKRNVHQGWETAFHLFILASRNPDWRWTICSNLLGHCGRWLFVCLMPILPFLRTHRGTEQCSRWNRLPRHLCH